MLLPEDAFDKWDLYLDRGMGIGTSQDGKADAEMAEPIKEYDKTLLQMMDESMESDEAGSVENGLKS